MAWQSLVDVNLNTTSDPGWCLAFAKDAVGAPGGVPTARAAWDNAVDKHWGDYNLPDSVVAVFWSWVGDLGEGPLDYGHVCIWVPGRGLFSSPKRWSDGNGSAWYGSIDEVSNWLGASYLGWSSDLNGLQLSQWVGDNPVPVVDVASNQRIAGPLGVFRRAEPTQDSEHLQPDLEAGEIGNFVGYVHGEDRGGNDIWFRGISGNYFWSGAFTNPGTDGLSDLNAPSVPIEAAATPEHAEVPTVLVPIEELYPATDPAPAEVPTATVEEATVAPTTDAPVDSIPTEVTPVKENIVTNVVNTAEQEAQIATLPSADLGAIIPTAGGRKLAYSIYAGASLIVNNTAVAFAALQTEFPAWLIVSIAVIGNLAIPFSAIAIANAKNTTSNQ
jgi:hypothetical protein